MRWRIGTAVFLLVFLVRGGILWFVPAALESDPDGYRRLAENLLMHGTFGEGNSPTAYRPPLYPLLLAGCLAFGGHERSAIGLMHILLGAAAVGLTFVLGRRWGLSPRAALLAALLVLCDPILLFWSAQIMTETPAACLAVAGLLVLTWACSKGQTLQIGNSGKLRIILAGFVSALGALCRPALLVWTVAAGVVLSLLRPGGKRFPTTAFLFILGAALTLLPWLVRNYLIFGRPIITTTHGGYTMLLGNNPSFYAWLRAGKWGDVWQAEELSTAWSRRSRENEVEADRLAYQAAWQAIRREPGMFAYACVVRLARFWSPLPHRTVAHESWHLLIARYLVAIWYICEFALAVAGLGYIYKHSFTSLHNRPREARWLWGLLLVLSMMLVHTVYWSDMRMRAVVMPVVALAAAAAIDRRRHGSALLCDGANERLTHPG